MKILSVHKIKYAVQIQCKTDFIFFMHIAFIIYFDLGVKYDSDIS